MKNLNRLLGQPDRSPQCEFWLPQWLSSKEFTCNAGDAGSIPGLRRSPGIGSGSPLHYSCLENPMNRGTWWATVHGVSKSRTKHTHARCRFLQDSWHWTCNIASLNIDFLSGEKKKKTVFAYTTGLRWSDKKMEVKTSLVIQWLRIHLALQGTWVQSWVQEDPTCCGAAKFICSRAQDLQLLSPCALECVVCNKRSYCSEKPLHRN